MIDQLSARVAAQSAKPAPRPVRLSKSKIIAGRQCHKRLWLQVHKRDVAGDTGNEMALATGHEVGAVAQQVYRGGSIVGTHEDISGSLTRTQEIVNARGNAVLFEAAFQADGVLVFADIVEKKASGLHLVEVKSSTSVKDYYRDDVAVQAHVMMRAGHAPASVAVRVIDNQFIYRGDGDYRGLFRDEDLTEAARKRSPEVAVWIAEQQQMLAGTEPDIAMGEQCSTPYGCEFQAYCSRQCGAAVAEYPVTMLPRGGRLVSELQAQGYADLRKVPAKLLGGQTVFLRMREASRSGKPILDPMASAELAQTTFPRYYLDFEGVSPAVPRWKGTRPYQQLPFQWSLHIERADGSLEHREFLQTAPDAPMRPAMTALLAAIGKRGTVFVYNRAYEGRVLRDMAGMFPELGEGLLAIEKRFVDLLDTARRHYYHPDMKGSWSIKAVLPTIAPDLDYGNLGEVQDGSAAQMAFLECIAADTAPARREEIAGNLLKYCERDTLAMVRLVQAFSGGKDAGGTRQHVAAR